jgi:hypothetical protein
MSLARQMLEAERTLAQLRPRVELVELQRPQEVKRLREHVDAVATGLEGIRKTLAASAPPVPYWNSPRERLVSLVLALKGIAGHPEWIAKPLPPDSLWTFVCEALPEPDRGFWKTEGEGPIVGLIRDEAALAKELESRSIIAWLGEVDSLIRIVDLSRPSSRADIFRCVSDAPGGFRCRACGMEENRAVDELIQVDVHAEHRPDAARLRNEVRLTHGLVYVHAQCLDHWELLVETAERDGTLERAEAIDAAAAPQESAA